jgi:adenosylhomocysteinase
MYPLWHIPAGQFETKRAILAAEISILLEWQPPKLRATLNFVHLLAQIRQAFFESISSTVGSRKGQIIVLTHLLDDRPELLAALERIAPIAVIIAIPYSVHEATYEELKSRYTILRPSLDELRTREFILATLSSHLNSLPTCIVEIGGYFAPWLNEIRSEFGCKIIGFQEDTESGHRAYLTKQPLPYPVLSVARSPLKQAEDHLVGPSCCYSAEKILREQGVLLRNRSALVIGYGKVGRGTAQGLLQRGLPTQAFDIDPIRNTVAAGDGMLIPSESAIFETANIIFGCTGAQSLSRSDLARLQSGTFLVSCSSKDVEFDLNGLQEDYSSEKIGDNIELFQKDNQKLFLLAKGTPVNFLDNAVIGPALSLVQAEIIMSLGEIFDGKVKHSGEIEEASESTRKHIAKIWQEMFFDPKTGGYIP